MLIRITILLLTLTCCVEAAHAARPTPAIGATCDMIEWRSAQLGREKLPAELGVAADGLLVVTGGAFASGVDAAQIAALADAGGFDVVNLAHRDLTGDAAAFTTAINAAKAKFISASFALPQGTPWKSHAVIERGGKRIAIIGVATQSAHVAKAMPGVQFTEPAEALKKAIAEAGN